MVSSYVVAMTLTLVTLAWPGLMAAGVSATILSIIDMITPVGSPRMECCSSGAGAGTPQQRWPHGRGHRRRNLTWNIAASKNVLIFIECGDHNQCYSESCLIDEGETFLLTGGLYSKETVSRYNINGWLEDLDNLNTGRRLHGCTMYTNNDGVKVIMLAN